MLLKSMKIPNNNKKKFKFIQNRNNSKCLKFSHHVSSLKIIDFIYSNLGLVQKNMIKHFILLLILTKSGLVNTILRIKSLQSILSEI